MEKITFVNNVTKASADTFNTLQDNVEDAISYSTTETEAGTWINGETIYRKVIDIGALPNATTKDTITDLPTTYTIIKANGIAIGSTAELTIPSVNPADNTYGIGITLLQSSGYWKVTIGTGIDRSSYTGYVVLEYIKTN